MRKVRNLVGTTVLILFILCILLPLLMIMVWVVTERWAWPSLIPHTFSLRAVNAVIRDGKELTQLFASSVGISFSVATICVIVGTMTARALVFYDFRGKQFYSFLSILPLLIPGTVFAMGVQIPFIKMGWSGTVPGVIIAHVICSLPYAILLMQDGTKGVGSHMEDQARVLGANAWQAFYRVTLPNLVPVLLSAFSMAYIVSFSQYFLTLMIGGGVVKTFAIVMVPYIQSGERNFASVYSIIFLVLTIVLFGLFERVVHRINKNREVNYY